MAAPVFLCGGGGIGPEFDPFLEACVRAGRRRILVIVAGRHAKQVTANALGYRDAFRARGVPVSDSISCEVSAELPMTRERFSELDPSGVFVAGGLTSIYWEGLCQDRAWVEALREADLPYAGFSAGAAVAARQAILGGWRVPAADGPREVLAEGYSEDLDGIEARPGLDLVPFSVDAHASQWGTLTRLLHAVRSGLVPDGVAIDENTLVRVARDAALAQALCSGRGFAYRAERSGDGVRVSWCPPVEG